jgi:hypothetical protein
VVHDAHTDELTSDLPRPAPLPAQGRLMMRIDVLDVSDQRWRILDAPTRAKQQSQRPPPWRLLLVEAVA